MSFACIEYYWPDSQAENTIHLDQQTKIWEK